jgi:integrase
MISSRTPRVVPPSRSSTPASSAEHSGTRDWFLRDSHWDDVQWVLAPTSAVHEDRPVVIRWDFTLPNARRFTHRPYGALLESSRRHLALLRVGPSRSRTGCTAPSLRMYFQCMRTLIRWMIQERLQRFADLDAELVADFARSVRRRRGRKGSMISRETLSHYYRVLIGLYRHRGTVRDALQIDPFPGLSVRAATPGMDEGRPASYTPDIVAVPLIQGAIEFLNATAFRALAVRESCLQSYQRLRAAKVDRRAARLAVLSALKDVTIDTPLGPYRLHSYWSLTILVDYLYSACFVILSYLVGLRISEILHLQAGCVRPFSQPGSDASPSIAVIVGTIYKSESYHGRHHQWIAPPPAVHAITVLEALSEPHRMRSSRGDLWQRPRVRSFGIDEWLPDTALTLRVSDTPRTNARVNQFVKWLRLPLCKGRRWKFSSHQGRKTFARFVALRDRTAIYALAQHLGHRDVRQTDQGYVSTDYQLHQEIETEVLDQSISAWELMLSARTLGGRMGAEVLARRPRFRGSRVKQEIRAYARMLAETGLTLGVCEWGYCVYREEVSACHGSPTAPDPVRREPSTCVRCKNFSLTQAHRPYWIEQVERHQRLLNDPDLPTQTLKIARTRLDEARALIRSMDSPPKEVERARTVPR